MQTIAHLANKVFKRYPEKLAVKDKYRGITYKELQKRSYQLYAALRSAGVEKGDRIGILMSNRLEHVELDLGVSFGGFIKVPVNYRLHPKEVEFILENAEVKVLIGEEEYLNAIDTDSQKIFIGNDYEEWLMSQESVEPEIATEEDDLFAIMYTSGTTGRPKGVMVTHRNMVSSALSLALACEITPDDVAGHVAPLTHGSNPLSHISWLFGLTQIVFDKFEPAEFLNDMEKEKVTFIFMVPTMVNLMIQNPDFDPKKLANIKSINMAGSPIAASKLKQAIEKAGPIFIETYGQVEAPMTITVMPRNELANRLESCGAAGPFVEMKIVDDEGAALPHGKIGEIICKGPLVMKGYWRNEPATNEALRDGWLYTGDLGWTDENGYLHIVDRKKDVIISGGLNIYPREIEEVLNKHDGIKETSVVGMPHEKWGEAVIAYCVLNEGAHVEPEELLELCKNNLASFKKPKEIHIVKELPKSSYGKILKRELKAIYGSVTT
ncbi:AMP-binding protein [Psychrobacillus sp. NEAU-3TGS]|uniref:class I adenylate-forming enzyme family protein n=1 Tax=Psychrobacillus sp. NEAU-3TGS TaxID=2995412 RepID=UPI0024976E9D|nr:AMP-binding protein [Psychrobacillus sp. NEAU-3TGS]MDI2589741.1 AMP-binding protein [Psychrobacillus sp. NEAU-3TGS]